MRDFTTHRRWMARRNVSCVVLPAEKQTNCTLHRWHDTTRYDMTWHDMTWRDVLFEEAWRWEAFRQVNITKHNILHPKSPWCVYFLILITICTCNGLSGPRCKEVQGYDFVQIVVGNGSHVRLSAIFINNTNGKPEVIVFMLLLNMVR
jgi:hypothetical protein